MLWTAPPLASFFGFRSRAFTSCLVSFLCAILFSFPVRFLTPLWAVYAINVVITLLARLGTDVGTRALDCAALGVLFRFQVPNCYRLLGFFFLCHFIFPRYLFWVVLSFVLRRTHRSALDSEQSESLTEPHRGIEPRCDCLTLFLLVFQVLP